MMSAASAPPLAAALRCHRLRGRPPSTAEPSPFLDLVPPTREVMVASAISGLRGHFSGLLSVGYQWSPKKGVGAWPFPPGGVVEFSPPDDWVCPSTVFEEFLIPFDKPNKHPRRCGSKLPFLLMCTIVKVPEMAALRWLMPGLESTFRPALYAYLRGRGTGFHLAELCGFLSRQADV